MQLGTHTLHVLAHCEGVCGIRCVVGGPSYSVRVIGGTSSRPTLARRGTCFATRANRGASSVGRALAGAVRCGPPPALRIKPTSRGPLQTPTRPSCSAQRARCSRPPSTLPLCSPGAAGCQGGLSSAAAGSTAPARHVRARSCRGRCPPPVVRRDLRAVRGRPSCRLASMCA